MGFDCDKERLAHAQRLIGEFKGRFKDREELETQSPPREKSEAWKRRLAVIGLHS